jgi:hypothetical protein
MATAYVIIIWTTLHQFVGIDTGQFTDLQSCKVALAHRSYAAFNWGQCVPWAEVPAKKRYHAPPLKSRG